MDGKKVNQKQQFLVIKDITTTLKKIK